jgi:hypothetical protein
MKLKAQIFHLYLPSFFSPSSYLYTVYFTKPPTEDSTDKEITKIFQESETQPKREADKFTAIYEPIAKVMWDH